MKIEKATVVAMQYVLTDQEGNELERSSQASPMVYLHGHRNILPELEAALSGLQEGALIEVILPPERAYGLRDPKAVRRVPKKYLIKPPRKMPPGTLVRLNTESGARDALVIKAGKFNVDIDSNHPYADKHLTFTVTIEKIRAATSSELAHGHSHGFDGQNDDH
ncbi:MAG: peptidylprolyl isomerase [Gammaproteobacteria bacterium]|nr:peptidylprolyl isomerase [Gammaproteobacteria bacterium]